MRKIDPVNVKQDFAAGLADVWGFYAAAYAGLESEGHRSTLVESTLLSAAVLWEGFVSDLLLAYVNRDSTRFAEHLEQALQVALDGKPRRVFDAYATLSIPAHLRKTAILQLIDPRGRNLTFSTYAEFVEGAERFLVPAHRAGITGRPEAERRTVDALIALRNHIAHRSRQSADAMNQALDQPALHPTGLRRGAHKVSNVGAWLKARPNPGAFPRIETFLLQLGAIAGAI